MKKPFSGDYALTQGFGEHSNSYAKFGLKGHNGLDYGLPTGTKVLAPHDGKVIEATSDPKGYGNYIKIENANEGSVLAHNKSFLVKVGDNVSEGQEVAISDNTGNSTGPHLHWGYYLFPRNRKNGYAGFIDQVNLINISNDLQAEIDQLRTDRDKNWNLHLADQERIKELEEEMIELKNEIAELKKANISLLTEKEIMAKAMEQDAIHDRDAEIRNIDLEHEISELEKEKVAPIEPVIDHYEEVIEKIWPNIMRGKRIKPFLKRIIDKFWRWFR